MGKSLNENALITISPTGGKASKGTMKYRAALPNLWMQEMGITQEDRTVDTYFDGNEIIIQKASNELIDGYEKNGPINIQISGSGGGASKGTLRYNIAFLNRWMQQLEVSEDDRTFKRSFENERIIFKKI